MIAAIILAAGASSRMGTPKALLKLHNTTFLETILDTSLAAGLDPRVVVVGPDGDNLLSNNAMSGAIIARNNAPHQGPIGSIAAGLDVIINHSVDGAVVWPVDQPHVSIRTIQALIDEFSLTRKAITVPTFEGRRGHPVLFSQEVFAELSAVVGLDGGAKAVVRRSSERVQAVEVLDRAVLEDIDTPEDYERLIRGAPTKR